MKMKSLLAFVLMLVTLGLLHAQAPEGMNYQAIARDAG